MNNPISAAQGLHRVWFDGHMDTIPHSGCRRENGGEVAMTLECGHCERASLLLFSKPMLLYKCI